MLFTFRKHRDQNESLLESGCDELFSAGAIDIVTELEMEDGSGDGWIELDSDHCPTFRDTATRTGSLLEKGRLFLASSSCFFGALDLSKHQA
jgi:hypothetical protein